MSDAPDNTPRLERIARRAHEIYEARGGTDGRSVDDWLQAEREIDEAAASDDKSGVGAAAERYNAYGARIGRDSIAFASSSLRKRSLIGSQ